MNTKDFIARALVQYPDNEVVIFQNTRLTMRQLVERIYRVSNALINLGLKKGDRVGVLLNNCHQSVEAFYGIACAGLVLVPMNARNSADEHLYMLDNAEIKAVITERVFADMMASVISKSATVDHLISIGGGSNSGDIIDYEEKLTKMSPEEPAVEISDDDINSLRYTSGTTGKPKGVIHDHRAATTSLFNILTNTSFSINEDDVVALMGPVTHASGAMILPFLVRGAKVVILPGFDLKTLFPLIEKEKITTLYMVPTMIVMMLADPDLKKYDLSSLKTIRYGASPIPPDILRQAIEKFGNIFIQGYGLTEGLMPLTILSKKEHFLDGTERSLKLLTSVGRESLVARVRIMDDDGNVLSPDQVGEIVVQSDQNMKGYWKNPEATEEALRGGWLHTRDMGYIDAEGYIYLVDRKEDMIISGGFNIYPKEVEDVLYTHAAVLEAAVFGVPDDTWGESVRAAVTLKPGMTVTPEELIDHCKKHLASYKKPKAIDFIEIMPKSLAGKILRKDLKAPFWEGKTRGVN